MKKIEQLNYLGTLEETKQMVIDKIKQIENKLTELEIIKRNGCVIVDSGHGCSNIENLQIEYSGVKDLINSCKEFVYNQNQELSFRYYDKLKEKVSILIDEQNILARELQKRGSDRNYELESIFDDFNFDMSDFSNANKLSNNKLQSDDFNSFVDSMIARLNFQSSSETHSKSIEVKDKYPIGIEDKHSTHDPNLWNIPCYELFKYLYDNYYDGKTKRGLTNIWFFLKDKVSEKYILNATKDTYKNFIKTNYNVSITNFDKGTNTTRFDKIEVLKLNEHCINFENNIKNSLFRT